MSARYSQVIHFVGIAVLPVKASQHSMCQHLLIVSMEHFEVLLCEDHIIIIIKIT